MGDPATSYAPLIALRVTVRAPDLDSFVERYARHVAGDRIFIFSKAPQPVGTRVRFTMQLQSGEVLISGRGTVLRVQADTGDTRHPPGMELAFVPLDERSQTLLDFMTASRAEAAAAAPIVRAVTAPPSKLTALSPPLPPRPKPEQPVARPPSLSVDLGWERVAKGEPTPTPPPTVPTVGGATPPAGAATPPSLESAVAAHLATMTPGSSTVTTGPAPAFAEAWRHEPPKGDGTTPAGELPANPFSEVSDHAIEYFVEWSLEQSIGQRSEQSAHFSGVSMSLPGTDEAPLTLPPPSMRRTATLVAAGFAAGLLVGGVAMGLARRRPATTGVPVVYAAKATVPATVPPPAALAPGTPAAAGAAQPAEPPNTAPAAAPVEDKATLRVISRPPGADVNIDGVPAGRTPLVTQVSAGAHEVTLAKERYAPATSTSEAPGQVHVDLRRPAGTLRVTSTPSAAEVQIGGQVRGRTPLDVKLPAFERYDVRVTLAGTRPWRKSVYLRGAAGRVDAALEPARAAPAKPARH